MNKFYKIVVASLLLACSAGLSQAHAEAILTTPKIEATKAVFTSQEEAIETKSITVITDQLGNVVEVISKPCPSCSPITKKTDGGIRFFTRNTEITAQQAMQYNGKPGAIFYDLDSNKVTSIKYMTAGEE